MSFHLLQHLLQYPLTYQLLCHPHSLHIFLLMSLMKTAISWLQESSILVTSFTGPYTYAYMCMYLCIYLNFCSYYMDSSWEKEERGRIHMRQFWTTFRYCCGHGCSRHKIEKSKESLTAVRINIPVPQTSFREI